MAFVLALLTFVGWGAGDIFGVYATRKIGAYLTSLYVYIFGFLIASSFVPFVLSDFSKITFGMLVLNICFGSFLMLGNFMLNEAFKRSNASIVGVIVQSFPALVLLLSALIFKDQISFLQIIWMILIFIGMIFCIINFNDFGSGKLIIDKGIKYALSGALIFTIYFTFLRVFIDQYGWFWPNYIAIASFPISLVLIRFIFGVKEKITIPRNGLIITALFFTAVLLRGADIALNVGISMGYSAIVTPISSASPILFVGLSYLIFRDKITKQQGFGIIISLLGIILLGYIK